MANHMEIPNQPYKIEICSGEQCRLLYGAAGGLIAGVVFAVYEALVTWPLTGSPSLPLRMIGAIVLGDYVIQAWYPSSAAAIVGLCVHAILSLIYGIGFARIVNFLPTLATSPRRLIVAGSAYGLALWLINYYLIAVIAGLRWFSAGTYPIIQGLIGHTLFFGAVVGFYLSRKETALSS
jgi:hypothetical protein